MSRLLSSRSRAISRRLSSAEFDPRHVPGLALWVRGDWSPITLNGSNVSQWNDISGNGNHPVQSTEANQPDDLASGINGRRNVDFVAANGDHLDIGDFSGSTLGAAFFVFEPDAAINAGTSAQFLLGDNTAGATIGLGAATTGLTNEIITIGGTSGQNFRVGWTHASDEISAAPHILSARWTGSTYELCLDGEVKSTSTFGTPALANFGTAQKIGGNESGGANFDGKKAELVLYNQTVSAANRTRLNNYFSRVHGIDLA